MQLNHEAASARFRQSLTALWPGEGKLGLAVSGGPDSMAMLLLAAEAFPDRIEAATVDHRLRTESGAEAAMVAGVCAGLGVPHEILAVEVEPGNVQSEARTARYAAQAEWTERRGLTALLTAHHADDQAETLLLRLNRGSGAGGLAGIRAVGRVPGTRIPLLRPLLDWRRADLAQVINESGVTAADDPSNADPKYDRARVRKHLTQADWLDIPALAASAAHLADADAALDWAAAREWSECVTKAPMGLVYRPQAPRAVALRVIARVVRELDGTEPRGSAVARLFDSLVARQPASIGGLVARTGHDGWSFTKAPARRT
ncbi:tRNA lysidine(34) synthetase TilS [Novosphingobium sp.]|uniref:tRNA lysidine(34) synthetase TilS n=1 Tax=Novosphingobium sp. TaxID=1874826 RepID=UPI00286E6DB5|nr:tRNA lysidine(34) synthetase TilS [Novosphingobium sp.]